MSDDEIREAMKYCFEAKPALCSECPIRDLCEKIDADTLGEIFTRMKKGESEDNDF